MSKNNQQLSATELSAIKEARMAKQNAANVGVDVNEPQTTSHETKSYDTFIEVENLPSKGAFYPQTLQGQGLKVEDLLLIQGIDDQKSH